MKILFFKHVLACISLGLTADNLFCQDIKNSKNLHLRSVEKVAPDYNRALPVYAVEEHGNAIHIKALRRFLKDFRNAEDVSWRISRYGNYVAEFSDGSVQTIVEYNTRGMWNFTVKRYPEDKLPESVRSMVKSTYTDNYTIKEAAEGKYWQNKEIIVYTVVISNGNDIKILTIYNAEMKILTDIKVQKEVEY